MARPRKQTAEYFPHFVADSRTKFILEDGWGNDGYAFWFKLLELLCKSDGHAYNCAENGNKRYLTAYTKIDESTTDAILEALTEAGKIDRELWEQKQIIWCQTLVDNLSNLYSKRTVSSPEKPNVAEFSERKPPIIEQLDVGKPQSKGKESRGDKSKGEEPNGSLCPEAPAIADSPDGNVILTLPLNDKTEYPIYEEQEHEWAALYPAVDVIQQLRNMKGWLNANPKKRKTKAGILRFINGWLSREQDKRHTERIGGTVFDQIIKKMGDDT